MRERGLVRAQQLTWDATARGTLAVFDELVPRDAATPARLPAALGKLPSASRAGERVG